MRPSLVNLAPPLASGSSRHLAPYAHPAPFLFPRSVKHSLAEENVAAKLSPEDKEKVQGEVEAALSWVATNQVGAGAGSAGQAGSAGMLWTGLCGVLLSWGVLAQ